MVAMALAWMVHLLAWPRAVACGESAGAASCPDRFEDLASLLQSPSSHRLSSVKRLSAERQAPQVWNVMLPKNSTDASEDGICNDLPGDAECIFEGHPDEHGIPIVEIRASLSEMDEILRKHPEATAELDAPMSAEDAPMSAEDAPMSAEDAPMSAEDAPLSAEDEAYRIWSQEGTEGGIWNAR